MKKSLSFLLALVMIVALFAGCSGVGATEASTKQSNGPATSDTTLSGTTATPLAADDNFNSTGYPIAKKPVTFTALVSTSSSQADDWNKYTAQKYWSEYTNVYFDYQYISDTDWNTQVNLKLSPERCRMLLKPASIHRLSKRTASKAANSLIMPITTSNICPIWPKLSRNIRI